MTVLAIDPGRTTGYAVVEWERRTRSVNVLAVGVIPPPPGLPRGIAGGHALRRYVGDCIGWLVADIRPTEIAWEERIHQRGGTDVASQGAYSAVAEQARTVNEREFTGRPGKRWGAYSPLEVRYTLFGSMRRRTEAEVRRAVEAIYGLERGYLAPDTGYHKTDALAVATAHLRRIHGWRPAGVPTRSRIAPQTMERLTEIRRQAVREPLEPVVPALVSDDDDPFRPVPNPSGTGC